MAVEIHRIEPRPAYPGSGVRKPKARRDRNGEAPRRFRDVIDEEETDKQETKTTPPIDDLNRSVSPPTEEDGGMHVDLLG